MRLLLIGILLAGLGAAAFLLFESDAGPAPTVAFDAADDRSVLDAIRVTPTSAESTERSDVVPTNASAATGTGSPGWAIKVVGRVVDEQGAGVASAAVRVRNQPDFRAMMRNGFGGGRRGGGGNFDWRAMLSRRDDPGRAVDTTDEQGYYAFTTAVGDDETLELAAVHTNLAPASTRVNLDDYDEETGEVFVSDLVLDLGATVRGQVADDRGQPVANALVTPGASRGRGRGFRGGGSSSFAATLIQPAHTDAFGVFEFRSVPGGAWSLTADADGYLPGRSSTLEVEGAEPIEDVKIEITIGAPFSGRVVDETGQPIAEARVTVSPQRSREEGNREEERRGGRDRGRAGRDRGSRNRATATTDGDGEFTFDAVALGDVTVRVEHDQFLTLSRESVNATSTPRLELTLAERLKITGIVVDSESGAPVPEYGITARRIDNNSWGRFGRDGGRGGRGGDRGGRRDRGRSNAGTASDDAQEAARDAYYQARIGGAGMAAGETPKPTPHPDGKFALLDLLPGKYALDIDAPGYIKVAAKVVELNEDAPLGLVTVAAQRGTVFRGIVLDAIDGEPVRRARVELSIAPPPTTPATPASAEEGRRNERDAMRQVMRSMWSGNRGTRIARVTTERDGTFEFKPVLGGNYTLRVTKNGYSDLENPDFVIPGGRDEFESRLELSSGARVFGRVLDHDPELQLQVAFTSVDGNRETARVDRETGEYDIDGLEAGEYFVEVSERERGRGGRGGRGGDRGGFQARLQSLAGRTPHLILGPGQSIQHDVTRNAADVGVVTGVVFENGQPKGGFEVRLERLDEVVNGNVANEDQARMVNRIVERMTRDRVGNDGKFEIDGVLPGSYRLEVTSSTGGRGGRGGRGNGGVVHAEQLIVTPGSKTDLQIAFQSGGLKFAVRSESGASVPRGTTIHLVSYDDAGDKPANEWRGLDSYRRLRVQGGNATVETLAIGAYRYSLSGLGLKGQVGDVVVSAGNPRTVELTAAEQTSAEFVQDRDKDGDGKLSSEELPQNLQQRMGFIDSDGDGMASVQEFDALRETLRASGAGGGGRGGAQGGGGRRR